MSTVDGAAEPLARRPLTRATPRTRTGASQADVAALAGVSGQTVSRVANGVESVLPETRQRVLDAMEQLGYSLNSAARALRNGSFDTIGLIAHQLARTGESRTAEAVIEAARAAGHTVTLLDVASPSSLDVAAAASRLSHQSIDGLVIIRAEIGNPVSLTLPAGLPVVVSDSRFEGHLPTVGADQVTGTRLAVEHLLNLGHRTVHLLAGPSGSIPAQVRRDEWERTLVAHGRDVPTPFEGDWTPESGQSVGRRLRLEDGVTAVLAANDEMAAGLMVALHERGISVPGDVSIVGFDDVPLAEYLWPPLTTVRQDFGRIGTTLVDMLLDQMHDGDMDPGARALIPVELVVRASTGRPRSSPQ